jgi:uncharacterized protein (TIGR02145 family)
MLYNKIIKSIIKRRYFFMSYNIMNKAILKAAGAAVFATVLCVGCYDLGIEPSVKPPVITTFVDVRDGHVYKKEQIGDQIWMVENLNYAADGSLCYGEDGSVTAILVPNQNGGKTVKPVKPGELCDIYGRLYDWYTAMGDEPSSNLDPSGVEGVCPVGWHLPSDAEWKKLIDYVGAHSGTKLKSHEFDMYAHATGHLTPEGRDIYTFSALLGGMGTHSDGTNSYTGLGTSGSWWTATEAASDSDLAYRRYMSDNSDQVQEYHLDKHSYFASVRCVHD